MTPFEFIALAVGALVFVNLLEKSLRAQHETVSSADYEHQPH